MQCSFEESFECKYLKRLQSKHRAFLKLYTNTNQLKHFSILKLCLAGKKKQLWNDVLSVDKNIVAEDHPQLHIDMAREVTRMECLDDNGIV